VVYNFSIAPHSVYLLSFLTAFVIIFDGSDNLQDFIAIRLKERRRGNQTRTIVAVKPRYGLDDNKGSDIIVSCCISNEAAGC
jgi:hypothetical protein